MTLQINLDKEFFKETAEKFIKTYTYEKRSEINPIVADFAKTFVTDYFHADESHHTKIISGVRYIKERFAAYPSVDVRSLGFKHILCSAISDIAPSINGFSVQQFIDKLMEIRYELKHEFHKVIEDRRCISAFDLSTYGISGVYDLAIFLTKCVLNSIYTTLCSLGYVTPEQVINVANQRVINMAKSLHDSGRTVLAINIDEIYYIGDFYNTDGNDIIHQSKKTYIPIYNNGNAFAITDKAEIYNTYFLHPEKIDSNITSKRIKVIRDAFTF